MSQPTYNHAFTLGFQIPGSSTDDGSDLTAEQVSAAITKRVADLMANNELLEAVGGPFDSFTE